MDQLSDVKARTVVQWNLSDTETLIREVSLLQGCPLINPLASEKIRIDSRIREIQELTPFPYIDLYMA